MQKRLVNTRRQKSAPPLFLRPKRWLASDHQAHAELRHFRRTGIRITNGLWSHILATRPSWLKWRHAATDRLRDAQAARRHGDYGLAKILLKEVSLFRSLSEKAMTI